jgi:3-oxoacyl-[acyl-carrier-protein] synthase III
MTGVALTGMGHYAPERRVSSAEIETRLGLDPGWIVRRTGIEARRYVAADEALSDMACHAGSMALDNAGLRRSDVGLLLLATSTPDHLLPPSAPLVAHRLGLTRCGGIDLAGACGGFLYALALADSFVRSHAMPVLVIAGNVLSRRINVTDRASSVLFADAAGAVVLEPTARREAGIRGLKLAVNGAHYDLIKIEAGGSRKPFAAAHSVTETLMVISNGQKVYAEAVGMMTETSTAALAAAGMTAGDIRHFIPHQANARMMKAVAHNLALPPERLCSTIAEFGNSSAATIPFTLSHCAPSRAFAPGDTILMTAAGAGLTGGALIMSL